MFGKINENNVDKLSVRLKQLHHGVQNNKFRWIVETYSNLKKDKLNLFSVIATKPVDILFEPMIDKMK